MIYLYLIKKKFLVDLIRSNNSELFLDGIFVMLYVWFELFKG